MAAALDVAALKATVQGEAALQAAVSVHEVGGGVEAAAHTRSAEHETAVHETRGARDPRCTRRRGARGGGARSGGARSGGARGGRHGGRAELDRGAALEAAANAKDSDT